MAKFNHEPRERTDAIKRTAFPSDVWPKAEEYRIVDHELDGTHRYGLEALYKGEWVDVECYDNGCDDYGQLYAAKWVPLRTYCRWSVNTLKRARNDLLGLPQPKTILKV